MNRAVPIRLGARGSCLLLQIAGAGSYHGAEASRVCKHRPEKEKKRKQQGELFRSSTVDTACRCTWHKHTCSHTYHHRLLNHKQPHTYRHRYICVCTHTQAHLHTPPHAHSLSLSLSPSLSLTHTYTHTYILAHTCAHTYTTIRWQPPRW